MVLELDATVVDDFEQLVQVHALRHLRQHQRDIAIHEAGQCPEIFIIHRPAVRTLVGLREGGHQLLGLSHALGVDGFAACCFPHRHHAGKEVVHLLAD
ncbi:hypothetical protein D3C78_1335030 [compost metagenome]